MPDPDFPMMAVDSPLERCADIVHRRQAFAVGQPDFGAQMFQPDECAHDCAPGVRFGAVADTMSPSSRPSRMMIDVPSDAPQLHVHGERISVTLADLAEASLPATAGGCAGSRRPRPQVAVSTTAFCPGRACTSFGNRHCSVRVDSVPCAVVADPAVSSAEEAEWRRRHSLPRHSPWAPARR